MYNQLEYENFLSAVGRCLQEHRLKHGYTQTEIAEKRAHLGQSTIAKLEAGPSKQVSLKVLFDIAAAYSLPLSEIIRTAEHRALQSAPILKSADYWELISKESKLLSLDKRKWFGKIVLDLLRNISDETPAHGKSGKGHQADS